MTEYAPVARNVFVTETEKFIAHHPLKTARLQHAKWRYLDNGRESKPVLVLLHGSRGNPYVFWRQFQGLGDDFRVISAGLPVLDDATKICEDLAQLLTQLGIEKVNILGSSIGGYFAQWFTHFHPQRVNKLFISSSIIDGRGFNNPSSFMSRFVLPFVPYSVIMRGFRKLETQDAKYADLVGYLENTVTGKLSSREIASRASAFHVSGAVPPLDFPDENITIIDCADEPYIDRAGQQRVVNRYAGARHYRLDEGHHFPYIFVSEIYNEIVRTEVSRP